jgi:hypothetical protein
MNGDKRHRSFSPRTKFVSCDTLNVLGATKNVLAFILYPTLLEGFRLNACLCTNLLTKSQKGIRSLRVG